MEHPKDILSDDDLACIYSLPRKAQLELASRFSVVSWELTKAALKLPPPPPEREIWPN